MKPRVMSLVLFTCMVGLLIAPYSVDLKTSLISLLAVAIGSGAAGALNMWYESDVDALMSRTCLRPIPTGKVKRNQALYFGIILSIISVAMLYYSANTISAILLAAGLSKRMNNDNKLIKKINGQILINLSLKNILTSSIDEVIVVLGHQKEIIEKIISKNKKIKIINNKNYKNGLASSIKLGLNHLNKNTEAFFICLGDMPFVESKIYNQMIEFKNNNEIIIPTYDGQKGNPVLFSKSFKEKIMSIDGDLGAKKIIEANKNKIFFLEISDKSILKDFNYSNDFFH